MLNGCKRVDKRGLVWYQHGYMNETIGSDSYVQKTRQRRFEACPVSAQSALKRCWDKKASPRAAIKAFCMECQGYDRDAISGCTACACPVYEYRPFQKKGDE